MAEVTGSLAKFISELTLELVPEAIKHEARRFVLDALGCVIAGARSELGPIICSAAGLFGQSNEATVAGGGKRFSALAASYGNGRLANCLDLDDTHPGGPVAGLHFGASVFGETLAFCEQNHLTSEELVLGVICGYEVGARISDVGTQMEIKDGKIVAMPEVFGFSLPATVGAAAATGRLLGQSAIALEQTFGIAAANSAVPTGPIWSRQSALPNTQCFDTGWAAMTGSFSARCVERGSTGLAAIFDGETNIFKMAGARYVNLDGLVEEMGSRWALTNTVYKPWPSCRFHHHSLSALKKLRDTERFEVNEVEEIVVGVNTARFSARFFSSDPPTFVSRQFSFPHSIAMLLLDVPPGPAWASERWAFDPIATRLRSRVRFSDYPKAATFAQYFVRGQFRQMPCSIEVKLQGRSIYAEVDFAWGDPWTAETRFSDDDLIAKFRHATELPTDTADAVLELVLTRKLGSGLSPIFEAMSQSAR